MANRVPTQNKPSKTAYRGGRSSKNAYKVGKLSSRKRFSSKKINRKLIFVVLALIFSFVFAVIFGNYLSKKAEDSKNTTTENNPQNVTVPSPDKISPKTNVNAFYVDFGTATPEISLSEQTGVARENGNSLFIELTDKNGNLVYSSSVANELSLPCNENLTLGRLKNHLEYYNDYAIGYFKSGFKSTLDNAERTKIQSNEALLLAEASDGIFSQLVVEFSENITKNNLIYYQSYVLNLKLACENTPIGVIFPLSFIENASNHGVVAEIMKIADFYVFDLGGKSAAEIESSLSSLIYFSKRYDAIAIISSDTDTLVDRIEALASNGVNSYVVK